MKQRPLHCSFRFRQVAGLLGCLLALPLATTSAQEPSVPPPAAAAPAADASANAAAPAAAPAPKEDPAAAMYLNTCAGCHTLTDAKLTGPGLATASKWPAEQLKTAIKRMETDKKVAPITDANLALLMDFIKDAKSKERLTVEQEKMQARFMAKMEPADVALGKDLFTGAKGFKNGGLACASCHAVSGTGGNLGPDLTGLFKKMGGKPPLISAIEKSSFKIMEPHYRRHPVTTQEAIHLAEYFSKIDPNAPVAPTPPFAQAGAGLAGVLLAGMAMLLRSMRAKRGRDTKLVRRRK